MLLAAHQKPTRQGGVDQQDVIEMQRQALARGRTVAGMFDGQSGDLRVGQGGPLGPKLPHAEKGRQSRPLHGDQLRDLAGQRPEIGAEGIGEGWVHLGPLKGCSDLGLGQAHALGEVWDAAAVRAGCPVDVAMEGGDPDMEDLGSRDQAPVADPGLHEAGEARIRSGTLLGRFEKEAWVGDLAWGIFHD